MTYRYCELCAGRVFPKTRDGIKWDKINLVVACTEDGRELDIPSEREDMLYWAKEVLSCQLDGSTLFVNLKGVM